MVFNRRGKGGVVQDIKSLARSLAPGESRSGVECPRCGHAESFSVFATDEGQGWKCHRAKCGESRWLPAAPGLNTGPASPQVNFFTPRVYPHRLNPLPVEHFLARRLPALAGLEGAARFGVYTRAEFTDEVVWALRGFDHRPRGHVSRDYRTKTIRTFRTVPGPCFGFLQLGPTDHLYLVEDMMSAAVVASAGGAASLALLGTRLSLGLLEELDAWLRIQRAGGMPHRVVVALDPDAHEKAREITRALTIRTDHDIVWFPTENDPKDMNPGQFARLMDA